MGTSAEHPDGLWTTGRSGDTRHRALPLTRTRLTALLQLPTVMTLELRLQPEFNFELFWIQREMTIVSDHGHDLPAQGSMAETIQLISCAVRRMWKRSPLGNKAAPPLAQDRLSKRTAGASTPMAPGANDAYTSQH